MKFRSGIRERSIIVKCGADTFLPFAVCFGVYIILFGTVSPGGGFQGGVMVASAALLLYLGYGFNIATKALKPEVLRVNEACGATLYVILGLLGIFLGANFCRNVFFNDGNVGDLISAGTITFMGYSVGYKVLTGVGFLLLLMLGLLAPDSDEDDEEEVACE
ncbi:MAG: MnhB domain-containing protein [Firmicutes bacterium]|nr:MnhB domain-containing protein [Bacillota bacterium]